MTARLLDAWPLAAIALLVAGALFGWWFRGRWLRSGVHVKAIRNGETTVGWRAYIGRIGIGRRASKPEAEAVAQHFREGL